MGVVCMRKFDAAKAEQYKKNERKEEQEEREYWNLERYCIMNENNCRHIVDWGTGRDASI